ncbi:hypothetical protein DACRYDRAFT_22437 [Dacryopinax primogenitus]|uniref:Uncharacterized protein n=1 Tax=Dacryopinax primogenitus (strain DJM 731) TaxID=1858805 RepID=M5GCY9_DACPD|nr:uncharacterized protein DACRYDRAFT_22437 [Dacryopinax primogenitus]EJU02053.1 hypothetical protein DACRYDRAFT_22437 [Dacryopinax primogenitus]
MLSVLPQLIPSSPSPTSLSSSPTSPLVLGSKHLDLTSCAQQEAIDRFSKLVLRSINTRRSVRLYCSFPTETLTDLEDLQELRARAFDTIHAVVARLRSQHIYATYSLYPSPEPLVILSAGKQLSGLTGLAPSQEPLVGDIGVPVLVIS